MERLHTMEINEIVFIATRNFCFKVREGRHDNIFKIQFGEASTLSAMSIAAQERTTFPWSTWSKDFSITGIGCRYDPRKSILKQGQAPYSTLQPVECHRIPLEFWAPWWLVREPIALQLSLRIKRQFPLPSSTQPPTRAWSYFYSSVAR
jgi:hypothetical protein